MLQTSAAGGFVFEAGFSLTKPFRFRNDFGAVGKRWRWCALKAFLTWGNDTFVALKERSEGNVRHQPRASNRFERLIKDGSRGNLPAAYHCRDQCQCFGFQAVQVRPADAQVSNALRFQSIEYKFPEQVAGSLLFLEVLLALNAPLLNFQFCQFTGEPFSLLPICLLSALLSFLELVELIASARGRVANRRWAPYGWFALY